MLVHTQLSCLRGTLFLPGRAPGKSFPGCIKPNSPKIDRKTGKHRIKITINSTSCLTHWVSEQHNHRLNIPVILPAKLFFCLLQFRMHRCQLAPCSMRICVFFDSRQLSFCVFLIPRILQFQCSSLFIQILLVDFYMTVLLCF